MLRRLISTTLMITTLGTSCLALADPGGPDAERYQDRGARQERGPNHHEGHGPDNRGHDNRSHETRGPEHRGPVAGHDHGWQAHDRLPPRYLDDRHAVRDWSRYDLPAPPPHHRWVNVDGEFILVAAATGVIASILLGRR